LSISGESYWQRISKDAQDAYNRLVKATPVERLQITVRDKEDSPKWGRIRGVMSTMLMEALPTGLVQAEIVTRRQYHPSEILFAVLRQFQPGGASEKAALLNSLKNVGANKQASVALENLRQWTRKKERALELGLVLSDPSLLYAALEEVSGQIKQETSVLKLAMARIELELETNPTYESVEVTDRCWKPSCRRCP